MITVIPYEQLGYHDYGWLKARYHFSFSNYYNPNRMGFGVLRVINDDRILPGTGFATHPHNDMEIITYVRKGAISHRDSQGHEGKTTAGNIQVMSAGSGIRHSEYNHESEETSLYQIWIEPKTRGVPPQWGMHEFPKKVVSQQLPLLVSGDGKAPLPIHQDAWIYGGRLVSEIEHPIHQQAYLLVSSGRLLVNQHLLKEGDGAEVTKLRSITLTPLEETEVVIIDVLSKRLNV